MALQMRPIFLEWEEWEAALVREEVCPADMDPEEWDPEEWDPEEWVTEEWELGMEAAAAACRADTVRAEICLVAPEVEE